MKIGVLLSHIDITIKTPYNEPLGGTESAICYFVEEMKLRNHEIVFFNKISEEKIIDGVPHVPAASYMSYITKNKIDFDIIIVSCMIHELFQLKITINNPNILYCLWTGHDIDQVPSKLFDDTKARDMVDLFIFVSNWQRERYVRKWNIPYYKTLVMKNGIGKPFEKYLTTPLNKVTDTLSYCSIPWRGLVLLDPIFKQIKEKVPNSVLKVFSGMNIYRTPDDTGLDLSFLKNTPQIVYNEGVSQTTLAKELSTIEYLTYPNIFPETSCITVLQAMACGCLVVTSDLGALRETMNGLNDYIDINIHNFDKTLYISKFVSTLHNLMKLDANTKDKLREYNRKYIKDNYTWGTICQKFEQDILLILLTYRKYLESDHRQHLTSMLQNFSETKIKECYESLIQLKYFPNINEYCVVKLNEGVCAFQFGKLDDAKKNFKICLQLRNDYNINKNIALLELQRNSLPKFIKYARQAISSEFDIELANLLAEKYEMLGLYNDAIGLYETIIYLDPNNVNSFNNLGNLRLLRISQCDDIEKTINETYEKKCRYLNTKGTVCATKSSGAFC
jgi:glycosyltransferase involved in cell wall biosynthesis